MRLFASYLSLSGISALMDNVDSEQDIGQLRCYEAQASEFIRGDTVLKEVKAAIAAKIRGITFRLGGHISNARVEEAVFERLYKKLTVSTSK